MESEEETLVGTQGDRAPVSHSHSLTRGDHVGRFVVLRRLGAGGMGVVHAAYDPELDRRIALKLLHPGDPGIDDATERRRRLLREAQAMAKLTHPNVVTVHDVGTHEDRVYIAMEHVEGQTLRAVIARRPPWRQALELLLAAGRGLAAAHDKGLVHRDFKPDNVMVTEDGRVLVMDFGLALATEATEPEPAAATSSGSPSDLRGRGEATWAGVQAGTPAYMAPEQMGSGPVDARADQFAFCVASWEALYGERPFAGSTAVEIATHVTEGRVREPPRGTGVPRALRRVLARGLQLDRARRWPDVRMLCLALERARARVRSRRVLLGLGAVALVAAVGVGGRQWQHHQHVVACQAEGSRVEALWPGRATALEAAMAGVEDEGVGHALLTARLDDWTVAWARTRTGLCLEPDAEPGAPLDVKVRGTSCLELQRAKTEEIIAQLERGSSSALRNAVLVAASLDDPAVCTDPLQLLRDVWPEGHQIEHVVELRRRLATARGKEVAGDYQGALEHAKAVLVDAEALGWPPLTAEVLDLMGQLEHELGRYDDAVTDLRRAYFTAGRSGADLVASDAASMLVHVLAQGKAKHEAALEWGDHATMLVERMGDAEGLRGAALWSRLAGLYWARGDYEPARALAQRSLEIRRRLTPEHPVLADSLNSLGNIEADRGDLDAAERLLQEALARRERLYGPGHPIVASSLNNLGAAYHSHGELEQARPLYERALAIKERELGSEHPDLAITLNNLADIVATQGHHDDARALYERALAIRIVALGPEHPKVATLRVGLGKLLLEQGQLEAARGLLEPAREVLEAALGAEHPGVVELAALLERIRATSLGGTSSLR